MAGRKRHFTIADRNKRYEQMQKERSIKEKEVITTVPVSLESAGPDESGLFLSHLFSASGEVRNVVLQIANMSDGPAALLITVKNGEKENAQAMAVYQGTNKLHIDPFKVMSGDIVSMRILGSHELSGLTVGFMWRSFA